MIELQSRDDEILRLCYEQRFLTREHLKTFFGSHISVSYRRLAKLEEADLIKRDFSAVYGKGYLLRLTKLGEKRVQEKYGISFPPLKSPNLNTLSHDALVTSVRLRLSQLWNANFVPERALQVKEFTEIPDGIFFFPSGKGIALEVECSDKGITRFLERIAKWKSTKSIAFILYVTPHVGLFNALSKYLESTSLEQPLGIVLWDQLVQGTPFVHTRMGEIDLFSKREF